MSLKHSLETLLGGPCYHMHEVQSRAETHGMLWWKYFNGDADAIQEILEDWICAVDWPASIAWRDLAYRNPDALVLLSHRGDAETWWRSADATVWEAMRRSTDHEIIGPFNRLLCARAGFSTDLDDADAAKARYDQHFAEVVAAIPPERLLLWQPGDGWEPICERLGLPVPEAEPVHVNATAEFRERGGFDDEGA